MGERMLHMYQYMKDYRWLVHSENRDFSYIRSVTSAIELEKILSTLSKK